MPLPTVNGPIVFIMNWLSSLKVPPAGRQALLITHPETLRQGTLNKLDYPYECEINDIKGRGKLNLACFLIPKFKGDWSKVPPVPLTNKCGKKDFAAHPVIRRPDAVRFRRHLNGKTKI